VRAAEAAAARWGRQSLRQSAESWFLAREKERLGARDAGGLRRRIL